MTALHPLEAELVVEPVPTATSVAWRLWWRLGIGEGVHAAGPAGPARLQLADGGTVIWTDYAQPDRLLQVDVPFGVVTGPDDDELLLAQGRVSDADAEVVDRLLGPAVRERVVRAQQPIFTASVAALDSWVNAGQAALIETMLDGRSQPVAGLWAIELEGLLDRLRAGKSCERRRQELAGVGAAAASLLPASLAEAVAGVNAVAHLLRTFAFRHSVDGPLLKELREESDTDVLGETERLIEEAAEELLFRSALGTRQEAPRPPRSVWRDAELPSFRGGPVGPTGPTCLRDHTVDGIVNAVAARLDGDELVVEIGLVDPAVGASQHLDVRVTGPDGLLAAAVSCERLNSGRLRGRLALPSATPADELVVVVGRRLPFAPLDQHAFDERQAVARSRRLVDALRITPASSTAARQRAADAWRNAGRPDLAAEVEELGAQQPFITEQAAAALRGQFGTALRQVVIDGADDAGAAAARDVAWSLGDLATAAAIEQPRRTRPDSAPLPVDHHDTLVLGLLASGETMAAQALDEQRPALV